MTYQAIAKRSVLELVEEHYAGNIAIPDMAKRRSIIGRVISTTHPDLSPGDQVAFDWAGVFQVDDGAKRVLFIGNEWILAKATYNTA